MRTVEIPDIGFKTEIPSSFDEMRQDEFILFSKLYLDLQAEKITYDDLKTKMVLKFLGVKYSMKYDLLPDQNKAVVAENLFRLSETVDFLFKQSEVNGQQVLSINSPWTKTHITEINGYSGPGDLLADISFIEYKNAHVAAIEYLSDRDEFNLDYFCAVLYRKCQLAFPLIGKQCRRPKFDETKTAKNATAFKNWPMEVKYAILLDFLAFEEYIKTGTFKIDGKDISFDILFKGDPDEGETADESENAGLTGLLFTLAESRVFGSVKETAEQNLYDVLFRLWQLQKQSEKLNLKVKK